MITRIFPVLLLLPLLFVSIGSATEEYKCGEKRMVNRPYGKVQLRVNCELDTTEMWVAEYRRDKPHGISMAFDRKTGRRLDSCFFRNGEEEGQRLAWDSTGFVTYRETFVKGVQTGKKVAFFGPGKPAAISNYDKRGKRSGLQQEWWPNGNKRLESTTKNDLILSSMEYYPNGHRRLRYEAPYQPKRSWLTATTATYETWAPDGGPAGKVLKGQGEALIFTDTLTNVNAEAIHVVYRDSLQVSSDDWDAATVARWLENYRKSFPDSSSAFPPKAK